MSGSPKFSDPRYAGAYAGLFWSRIRQRLQTGPLWRLRFIGGVPDRILFSPSCIWPSDPLVARDIYQGRFNFAGHTADVGRQSVFSIDAPSVAWEVELHSFGWLRHLQRAGSELAAENGRALVDDWMNHCGKRIGGPAWDARACAGRVIAWIQHARFILQNSEHGFYRRFMASLALQIRYLRSLAPGLDENVDLLHVRIALALSAVNLPTSAVVQRRSVANLEDQLKRQILPDGGHISRKPDVLPEILADLLPLAQVYVAASKPVPGELVRAIDRMFPMLRFFRHAGGGIAQFHGSGVGREDLAVAVLRHDNTNGQFTEQASNSLFQRLSSGHAVIIADIGTPLSGSLGEKNNASSLAFEFSSGRSAIVVNAGIDRLHRDTYEEAARTTAAHSALCLDDHSSARIEPFQIAGKTHHRVIAAPSAVQTQPWDVEGGHGFSARHDGFVKTTGIWHERGIVLFDGGRRLDGYDRLTPDSTIHDSEHRADVRFHLHPRISVVLSERDDALELTNEAGEVWRFSAVGAVPKIEDSIYLSGVIGPVYNQQIVLNFTYPAKDSVTWRFERV
ncbi:MAG: heparinase II/III family protein [Pseudomonadota bacterium]